MQTDWRLSFFGLAITLFFFVVVDARWVWTYRHGGIYDIDEAGYLGYSIIDYYGLHFGGLPGWISAIEMPSIQAPLTTALTSLLYLVFGLHIILGFAVTISASAVSIGASYVLARSLGARNTALVAAILTACCPVIINYARSYQFSMIVTCVTTIAILALVRSKRFSHIRWSLAFGISLGLMPLARTMVIAFVPGLILAALVTVLAVPGDRLRRLLILGGSLVVAFLVAATWLWPNGPLVAHYLFSFGYGAKAAQYGTHTSKLGPAAWKAMLWAFNHDVFPLYIGIVFLTVVIIFGIILRTVHKDGIYKALRSGLECPALPIIIFASEAIVALTTSGNKGTAFFAPIMPSLLALTAWCLQAIGPSIMAKIATSIVLAAATVAVIPLLDLRTPFAHVWSPSIPLLGSLTITDGRGIIEVYEGRAGFGQPTALEPLDHATSEAWITFDRSVASDITTKSGASPVVSFAFSNQIFNVNSLNLQELIFARRAFDVRMIDPTATGETVAGYLGWIKQNCPATCVLLTSDRVSGDFQPPVNRKMMETAAGQAGLTVAYQRSAPDGQIISFWTHSNGAL